MSVGTSLLVFLNRIFIHYWVKIDPRSKCPACGHRMKHRISWSPMHEALIHQCGFCSAAWGERPLVPASQWLVSVVEGPEAQGEPIRAVYGTASREPVSPNQAGSPPSAPKPVLYH